MDAALVDVSLGMGNRAAAKKHDVSEGQLRRARKADGLPMLPVGQPPKPKAQRYPLAPMSIGEDTYIIISRGHHDVHQFMAAVRRDGWDWPLGMPRHLWMKTMPARHDGYRNWFQPVPRGTRGAWPCTYVTEAWGADSYERLVADSEKQ